ncbi:LysM peptidoglycan-binding domain-containing protein [Paenibacillus sp. JSM ZJ436]|uniref:LysM peptidoglycan-binding domain-containing protein n=1 Tax=Paenibacillus sp. JSM ZJ436 TaxID=3376190 RepID=UPI0037BD84FD
MLKYSTYRSIYDHPAQPQARAQGRKSLSQALNYIMSLNRNKLLGILFVFFLGFSSALTVFAKGEEEPAEVREIVVQSGDTLWSIAASHKPDSMDIRDYIHTIAKFNGLNSHDIKFGEVLSLPLY